MSGALAWALAFFFVPVLLVCIDIGGALRAGLFRAGRHRRPRRRYVARDGFPPVDDFEIVVPIWGSTKYLINTAFLREYGRRVVLCSPDSESAEFKASLEVIARANGFRVFWGHVPAVTSGATGSRRQTSGVVRDRLVRDVHQVLTARYVVCIDADTITNDNLSHLVGQLAAEEFDLVSVRILPSNTRTWLGRIQAHEYRMAMRLRAVMPWMVSGACHAGRRESHRQIMERHTLFFQGNDVELGIIATGLGMKVGHVLFDVPTEVPETLRSWWRQRYAWSGGEFRLYFMNPKLAVRHPFLWAYGALITFAGVPLRWHGLIHATASLVAVAVVYVAGLALLHRRHWDRWLLVLPIYTLFSSLVLVPLGLVSYVRMVQKHHNAGIIRLQRHRHTSGLAAPEKLPIAA